MLISLGYSLLFKNRKKSLDFIIKFSFDKIKFKNIMSKKIFWLWAGFNPWGPGTLVQGVTTKPTQPEQLADVIFHFCPKAKGNSVMKACD